MTGFGRAGSRRVVPGDGRFHGSAGGSSGLRLRCFRWSGGWFVGEGDDGRSGAGGGVCAPGVLEGAGAFRLAGTVPVPVDDGTPFADCAGQGGVAGLARADGGEDGAAGGGEGDLAGLDGLPGAASFPRGGGGEGCGTRDAAGHLDGGGPGGEFLPEQAGGLGAEHRPGAGQDFASRSAVSDPSHRHLYSAASSMAGYSLMSVRSVIRQNISGTTW